MTQTTNPNTPNNGQEKIGLTEKEMDTDLTNQDQSKGSSTVESKPKSGQKCAEQVSWELKRPFPLNQVKSRTGPGGMTLHYIDARMVMARLDQVVGADGWESTYHTVAGHACCELRINYTPFGESENPLENFGHWITKSDGAGETNIEGEKGSFSDALKRAAVQHGIGRYLYRDGPPMTPERYEEIAPKTWLQDD